VAPNGKAIAFYRSVGDADRIWIANLNQTTGAIDSVRQLVNAAAYEPLFSPDGREIVFVSPGSDHDTLKVVTVSDGSLRTLPVRAPSVAPVGWSRNGSLYYTAPEPRFRRSYSIHRFNMRSATDDIIVARNFLRDARLSADGRLIVFKPTSHRFAIATSDGARTTPLDAAESWNTTYSAPQWVPGGDELVFTSRTQNRSLWKLSTGDSVAMRITEPSVWAGWPAVSPDGRYIAAIVQTDGREGVLIEGTDGTKRRVIRFDHELTNGPDGARLTWSPDGNLLAVTTGNLERAAHPNPTGIDVVDARTGTVQSLSTAHELQRFIWSSDSRAIRYAHRPEDSNLESSPPDEVRETRLGGADRLVRQMKSNRSVVTFSDFNRAYTWYDGWLIDLDTGRQQQLLDAAALTRYESGAFRGSVRGQFFSPDGQTLIGPGPPEAAGGYDRLVLASVPSLTYRIVSIGAIRLGDLFPVWTRDSRQVFFNGRDSAGVARLFRFDPAKDELRPITRLNAERAGIAFALSPDGAWVIVSRRETSIQSQLHALRVQP
jgi:Tol biopolymer transport system component